MSSKPLSRKGPWVSKGAATKELLKQGPHCSRVRKFALTKSEAKRLWKNLRSRADDPYRDALEYYRCPYCRHWHVGHHPQLKQQLREQQETRH